MLSAINDSNAPLGIIRSYTVIVNNEVERDKKFETIAAIIPERRSTYFLKALKNQ